MSTGFNDGARFLSKAKIKESEKWIEGYYVKHINRQICPIGDELSENDVKHYIFTDGFADWNMPKQLQYVEIDVNTLCQCTGVWSSKSNKYIYEHDIVEAWSTGYKRTLEVIMRMKGVPMFILYPAWNDGQFWNLFCTKEEGKNVDDVKIVGNKFDVQ